MKSSTHNHPNVQALRADRRFDAIVKKQEGEHQHLIAGHNKEMQALRDLVTLSMQRFDALFSHAETEIKDLSHCLNHQILCLREKVTSSEIRISDQRKTIEAIHEQLLSFHVAYSSKSDVEKFKKSMGEQIQYATSSHINSFQELQREMKLLFYSLQEELIKLRSEMQRKISQLSEKGENNFYVSRIDREGVLKEIRVYEKTVFIIEKKIENIYTLIDRISKRGELCHKPE